MKREEFELLRNNMYDPHQDQNAKRATRAGYRDLIAETEGKPAKQQTADRDCD